MFVKTYWRGWRGVVVGGQRGNDGTDPRLRHFITADNKTAAGSGRLQLYLQPQPRNNITTDHSCLLCLPPVNNVHRYLDMLQTISMLRR